MKLDMYHRLLAMQASRRTVLKGAAAVGALECRGIARPTAASSHGAGRSPGRDPENSGRRQGVSPPMPIGRRSASCASAPTKQNVSEGEFAGVELTLHGPQQPEPPQRPVPRLPEAVGGLYRRQDQLDRPRPGRLQRAPAAVDRHRHRRLRHRRDGRAVRGRRLRQGPRLRDARLGQAADRDGRLRRLSAGAGRHLERQDLSHLHRRRLPYLQLPHRRLLRSGPRHGVEGRRRRGRMGPADAPGRRCRR